VKLLAVASIFGTTTAGLASNQAFLIFPGLLDSPPETEGPAVLFREDAVMAKAPQECRKLSVAMIVRDAEDCLAASLDSVRNLADEIVVLDTGSQDSTLKIARLKATKVVSREWSDDFSAARNAALEQVTGDWVLWLDAGETLSPSAADALRKFIDNEADDKTAHYLLVHTPAQGANIAGEQVARIRLHPRIPWPDLCRPRSRVAGGFDLPASPANRRFALRTRARRSRA
jgi:glycosyltransferase involved in cell wall biosynthesis